eukprot:4606511-Ditylum_brightwellii.AAC.1
MKLKTPDHIPSMYVMFNFFHGGSEGVSVSVGNITPVFTTTGAKGIFCDMGDEFNATVVKLQSCLAVYSGKGSTEVSQLLRIDIRTKLVPQTKT